MACPPPIPATSPERGRLAARPPFETWFLAYLIFGFAVPGLAAIQVPLVVVEAGHRPFRVGAVIASQNWGVMLAPLWGWMADRHRASRAILASGFCMMGLAFVGLAFERSLLLLLMSGFLLGVGTGACTTMSILLVTRTASRMAWSGKLAALQMLGAIGTVLGLATAAMVGPRTGMLVVSFLSLFALLLTLVPPHSQDSCSQSSPLVDIPGPAPTRGIAVFAVFLAAWFMFSVSVAGFASLYPITMKQTFDVGIGPSSTVMALATLASLPLYGVVYRLIGRSGPAKVFAVGVAGRCAALLGLASLPSTHGVVSDAALGLAALFQAVWPVIGVASSALAAVLAPSYVGAAVGIFQATGALASGLGALLIGLVADRYGYQHVFGVAAIIAVASVLCTILLLRLYTGRLDPTAVFNAKRSTGRGAGRAG